MKQVRFTKRALGHTRQAQQWWRAHREKAPNLFAHELERALALIARAPSIGSHAQDARLTGVRRVLMPRTRYAVYYRVAPDDVIDVLAVWHMSRGAGPNL